MFLRRSTNTRDPLAVAMSGIRLGERVLQVGVDDPRLVGQLAAKTGLSGTAACVVADQAAAAKAKHGADKVGVLVDVSVDPHHSVSYADGSFDVVVVHSVSGLLAGLDVSARTSLLTGCARVLRPGGRIITIEAGTPSGLAALLRTQPTASPGYETEGGAQAALQRAGFSPVRVLGDREGLRFTEGLRRGQGAEEHGAQGRG